MQFQLLLYVAGQSTHSMQAIQNLRLICEQHLAGQYELNIIDVLQDPQAAEDARILAVPTLVLLNPPPKRRIVGDMANHRQLMAALNITGSYGADNQ